MGWGALIPLGMAAGSWIASALNNRSQERQQEKLMKQQIKGQKQLGKFNQELAMQTWEETNYEAQRRQMEKAGLNVGLMYNGQGGGGSLLGGQAGNSVTAGQANPNALGMGLQLGLQTMMQKAQIDNIKANTEKTKVDTAKTAGVDTEAAKVGIQSTLQSITNAETQNRLMGIQEQFNQLQLSIGQQTKEQSIAQAEQLTNKLTAEATSAQAKGEIDQATVQTLIQQANEQLNKTKTEINAAKTGIEATKTGIEATKTGIEQTKASTEQTKQATINLKQDEIEKVLHNQLRQNGIEPKDSVPMRIISRVLNNANTSVEKIQAKMQAVTAWLKGVNGPQTEERFKEIWGE